MTTAQVIAKKIQEHHEEAREAERKGFAATAEHHNREVKNLHQALEMWLKEETCNQA